MMCHKRCLKHVRQFPYLVLLVLLLALVGCREVNPDAVVPGGGPLEFEPIPQRGIQTQSSSFSAWEPIIDLPYEGAPYINFYAVDVDVYGTGLGSRFAATSRATVNIPSPETVERLYVQVVFKAGSLSNPINEFVAPDEIVLSTPVESKSLSAGQLHLAPLTDDTGIVVNNIGRVYETELQPASQVSVDITRIRKFGTLYTPRALIVYAQREITDYANGTMSAGKVVNRYLHGHSGFEQATTSLLLKGFGRSSWNGNDFSADVSTDLEVTFALAELGSDSRHVVLVAEAGGVRREVTLDQPTDGNEFTRYTLTLPNVPSDTDVVMATVISPKAQPGESVWDNGDSIFWHAVNAKMPYERPCWLGTPSNPLTTQAAVDTAAACTVIFGDLYVGPEDPADPITNLQGLRNVHTAEWVRIRDTSLRNLEGLENLMVAGAGSHYGPALTIVSNPLLESLEGLKGQEVFLGYVEIVDNASLETLKGLAGIQRVIGALEIVGNPSLRTLEGLETLTQGSVYVSGNASLERITDLINYEDNGQIVFVVDNPSLDCSLEPQPSFLPIGASSGNLVDCPVITP